MNSFGNIVTRSINYLATMGISDAIDIAIVAYLIYQLIMLVRRTNSHNLAKGFAVFIFALWLSGLLNLTMIYYLLRRAVELGLIALVVLFQPELRRLLENLGSKLTSGRLTAGSVMENAIKQTVIACGDMADARTGALIIFEREIKLSEIASTGTMLDATVSSELLKNIFFNKSPLHDGAAIVRDGRIMAAGCVLPLTKDTKLSKDLGMRHRAGIGLSEQSDAVVIIVSEESGSISVAKEGALKRHLPLSDLDTILRKELMIDESEEKKGLIKILFTNTFKGASNDEGNNEKNI